MSDTSLNAGGLLGVLAHLRHPLKLRLAVSVSLVGAWYFGFYSSVSDQMTATSARIEIEHKRVTTAREIDKLRKTIATSQKSFKPATNPNQLIQHIMDHLRHSPLKLGDLTPEKAKELGGYDVLGFSLNLHGTFADVVSFLEGIENDVSLLRVDLLTIAPDAKDRSKLSIELKILGLVEKASGSK